MNTRSSWLAAATCALVLSAASTAAAQITDGDIVTFDYTLRDSKGVQLESSRGKEPLTYQHGVGNLMPALEKRLRGMKPGETKSIRLAPDEGYGPRNPFAVQEVPRESLPQKEIKVGDRFVAQDARSRRVVSVLRVKETTVVVDFNHPLAGKTLVFDIKILKVQPGAARK